MSPPSTSWLAPAIELHEKRAAAAEQLHRDLAALLAWAPDREVVTLHKALQSLSELASCELRLVERHRHELLRQAAI